MRSLARAFDIASFAVVNDLEANARGVPLLGARDLAVVNDGEPDATGNCAVVSAGTGLGEAALVGGQRGRRRGCACQLRAALGQSRRPDSAAGAVRPRRTIVRCCMDGMASVL